MSHLIEAIFELLRKLLVGIFDLIAILFEGIEVPTSNQEKYSSRMMSFWERSRLLRRSWGGVNVSGRLKTSAKSACEGVAVLGASGSGKSSVVAMTTALTLNASYLLIDVDGKGWDSSAGAALRRGIVPKKINVMNPSESEQTEFIRQCEDETDVYRLAETLVYNQFPRNGGGDSKFWEFGAISVLKIGIGILKTQPLEFQHLAGLRQLLQRFNDLESFINQNATPSIWNDFLAFNSADSKVRAGFIQTALMAVNVFGDPGLAHITAQNTLNFEDFTTKKQAWYIQVSESSLKYVEPYLNLFLSQFFEFLQKNPPKKPVFLLLDEAGHIRIKGLPTILTTMRKYNVSTTLFLQDIQQLTRNYGKDGMSTILSGACAHKVIFPGMSLELAKILSDSFGRKSFGKRNERDGYVHDSRELFTASELIQGNKKKALYMFRNMPPYLMRLKPYYRSWKYRRLSKIKPPVLASKPVEIPPLININP